MIQASIKCNKKAAGRTGGHMMVSQVSIEGTGQACLSLRLSKLHMRLACLNEFVYTYKAVYVSERDGDGDFVTRRPG